MDLKKQKYMDSIELERRFAIGFNTSLSLKKRQELIDSDLTLEQIAEKHAGFCRFARETADAIHWLRAKNRSVIWYGESSFPAFGGQKRNLPFMLFCEGEKPDVTKKAAAVIGTRHATYGGMQQAYRFGLEVAENGKTLVTGFAEGIDQAAIRGALDAKGTVIGVLGCGHNLEYPYMTGTLRQRIIASGGCVISPFAPETVAYKGNFALRNLLIASCADIIVAVQAPDKSGTLQTCDLASSFFKSVYIGSEGVGDRYVQAGTRELAGNGARILCSLSDIGPAFPFRADEDPEGSFRFGDVTYTVAAGEVET